MVQRRAGGRAGISVQRIVEAQPEPEQRRVDAAEVVWGEQAAALAERKHRRGRKGKKQKRSKRKGVVPE